MATRNYIQLCFINKLTSRPTRSVKCKIILLSRMNQGAIQEPYGAEQ